MLLIMTCDWTESGVPWQTTQSPLRKLGTRPDTILEWVVLVCMEFLSPSTPCNRSADGDRV